MALVITSLIAFWRLASSVGSGLAGMMERGRSWAATCGEAEPLYGMMGRCGVKEAESGASSRCGRCGCRAGRCGRARASAAAAPAVAGRGARSRRRTLPRARRTARLDGADVELVGRLGQEHPRGVRVGRREDLGALPPGARAHRPELLDVWPSMCVVMWSNCAHPLCGVAPLSQWVLRPRSSAASAANSGTRWRGRSPATNSLSRRSTSGSAIPPNHPRRQNALSRATVRIVRSPELKGWRTVAPK